MLLAQYQLVGELLAGGRVLEIGCRSGQLVRRLAGRGVDIVGIEAAPGCRADPGASAAHERIVVGDPYRSMFSANAFDLVLVPQFERWSRRAELLREVKRVLDPGGVALISAAFSDQTGEAAGQSLNYEELSGTLSARFAQLRVLADMPFDGRVFAEFGLPELPDPQLDCSLVERDAAPTSLVAICADVPIEPLGYVVVQLPPEGTDGADASRGAVAAEVRRSQPDEPWAERLMAQLERAEARVAQERARAEQERAALQRQGVRLGALRERFEAAERSIEQLRGALEQQQRRAEGAESRCDLLVDRLGRGAGEFQRLESRVAELQSAQLAEQWRADELKGQLMLAQQRLKRLERLPKPKPGQEAPEPAAGGGSKVSTEVTQLRREVERLRAQLSTAAAALAEVEQLRLQTAADTPGKRPRRSPRTKTPTRASARRAAAEKPKRGGLRNKKASTRGK